MSASPLTATAIEAYKAAFGRKLQSREGMLHAHLPGVHEPRIHGQQGVESGEVPRLDQLEDARGHL